VFLLRAQFVDNPRAVVDQVLWSRKRRFCGTSGGWRVMCVVAVAGVSGRELRMPARGPVGGVRLGWLGRWGGVRGVADFFESFQCRKPGRGGVEAAAGGAAPGDWSTRWSSSTSTRVPGCSWGSRWKRQLFKSTSRGAVQHRRAVSVWTGEGAAL